MARSKLTSTQAKGQIIQNGRIPQVSPHLQTMLRRHDEITQSLIEVSNLWNNH